MEAWFLSEIHMWDFNKLVRFFSEFVQYAFSAWGSHSGYDVPFSFPISWILFTLTASQTTLLLMTLTVLHSTSKQLHGKFCAVGSSDVVLTIGRVMNLEEGVYSDVEHTSQEMGCAELLLHEADLYSPVPCWNFWEDHYGKGPHKDWQCRNYVSSPWEMFIYISRIVPTV